RGEFPVVSPQEVDYMDVSPFQTVSVAASLIPFLEHDDANRALMGSNMQRQSVPLLKTEVPLVGTGIEGKVARDSRTLIVSTVNGTVEKVTADEIVVRKELVEREKPTLEELLDFDQTDVLTYKLMKFSRTNQNTMINQRPVIRVGQKVKKGQVLADGCSTSHGELALGKNVLVAFLPWRGYNFEDAIILSERLVKDDIYTSVHIEEFELQVRDMKRGEEELTREIPNVSEEATKDLDENGIIRIGAEVKPGDILVGKVTPKGETEPTPEEKLLKAIFGDKAGDVKDASLKAPPGMHGIVIDTKLFSRKRKDPRAKKLEKKQLEVLENNLRDDEFRLKELRDKKLRFLLKGETSAGIRDVIDGKIVVKAETKFTNKNLEKIKFDHLNPTSPWTKDEEVNEAVRVIFEHYNYKIAEIHDRFEREKSKIQVGDELPPGIVQLAKVYVAKKLKIMIGDKMAGRHGNKGVVSIIVPEQDMPYLPDGTPVDIVLNPLGVPSRMNLGQILETNLGWAAEKLNIKYATPVFD
ncbi:MAG TPA: DNA-directed RNA polymerase subunit beta, partial [Bacteroidetes bacterium]|nr:DNA-directed RNA polymerase subunit beta [Bacteroidota bacterium]